MSKIGNKPIVIPSSVQLVVNDNSVTVKGKEGIMKFDIPKSLKLERKGEILNLKRSSEEDKIKSLHGLYRQLIFNAVKGIDVPWEKKLEIVGTGFNVKLQGDDLVLKLGYSHPVLFKKVPNIKYKVQGNNKIVVMGSDKQLVGEIAYQIKTLKKPDAYKGKGIRYEGEILKLKPGKKVKTTAGGTA